jgi:hypothetical protein
MSTSGSFDTSLWNPDFALHLFASEQQQQGALVGGSMPVENYWPGEVLLLAVYNHVRTLTSFESLCFFVSDWWPMYINSQTLSLAEIDRNFRAGLPNSLPVVWSIQVSIALLLSLARYPCIWLFSYRCDYVLKFIIIGRPEFSKMDSRPLTNRCTLRRK